MTLHLKGSLHGEALALLTNIRLGWKGLIATKTKCYSLFGLFIGEKERALIYKRLLFNKLECLPLANLSSLMLVEKARSLPKSGAPEMCFNWVGSALFTNIRLGWKGFPRANTLVYQEP